MSGRRYTVTERRDMLMARTNNVDGCIIWQGVTVNGYGFTSYGGKKHRTHRLSWMLTNGDIPVGKCVLHKCHNRPCINLEHLYIGTQKDNMQDMIKAGRRVNVLLLHPEKAARGVNQGRSKLTEKDVLGIRKDRVSGKTSRELAHLYHVCQSSIMKVIHEITWRHIL